MKRFTRVLAAVLATLFVFCSCAKTSPKEDLTFAEKIERIDLENFSVNASFSVEFSDRLFKLLENEGEDSLSMLKEIGIEGFGGTATLSRFKDNISLSGKALVNNKNVVSASAIVDMAEGDVYVSVPEVNKTALKIDLDDLGLGDLYEAFAILEGLKEAGSEFDYKLLMELYKDTAEYALTTLPEPEKSNTKLTVLGVSENVVAVTYTITGEDIMNTTSLVMNKLVHDKRFKTLTSQAFPIIMSMLEDYVPELALFSNLDEDDIGMIFDSYVLPEFENIQDELMYEAGFDEFEPIVVTYYQSGDNVTGFTIENSGQTVSVLSATNGGKAKAEIKAAGETLLTFSGTERKGIVNGTVEAAGYSVLVEDLDTNALEKGILRFAVVLDSKFFEGELPENMKVKFKTDSDFLTSNIVEIELYEGSARLVKAVYGLSIDEGKGKISVPKNAANDIEMWAKGCINGLDKIVDNLSKAGINKKYISQLNSGLSMLKSQAQMGGF